MTSRPTYSATLQCSETKRPNRAYVKYQVVIPKHIVAQAGWRPKDEVTFEVTRGNIVMRPCISEPKPKKLPYKDFLRQIHEILLSAPEGLTWSEIRGKVLNLPIKPNALWVRRMESDIGLKRVTQQTTYRRIWKIDPLDREKLNGYLEKSGSHSEREPILPDKVISGSKRPLAFEGERSDVLKEGEIAR